MVKPRNDDYTCFPSGLFAVNVHRTFTETLTNSLRAAHCECPLDTRLIVHEVCIRPQKFVINYSCLNFHLRYLYENIIKYQQTVVS